MTTPGIFNLLITDDTEQDSYLIAQGLLSKRLKQIKIDKLNNLNNILITLNNNKKKIESEIITIINKTQRNNKQKELDNINNQIKYYNQNKTDLIKPTVNDINQTHFLFINNQYKPFVEFGFEYIKSSVNSKPNFNNIIEFNVQDSGDFIADMFIYIRIAELKAYDQDDRVRYADFVGHKILKKCQFIISNNVLDEYDRELYNIYYNLHVPEGKKYAWNQCVGQESLLKASLIPDPVNNEFKEVKYVSNGFQTLKKKHNKLELFIPLLFWFNRDIRLAFPNHIKPLGQVKVRIELEDGFNLTNSIDIINDNYNQEYNLPEIEQCSLYTKHIYINSDIQDIFISKLGFNLIRVHKKVEKTLLTNSGRLSIQELKFPIESLYIIFRPEINEIGIDNFETWHLNSKLELNYIKTPIIYDVGGVDTLGINNIKYYNQSPLINSLSFESNLSSTYGINSKNFYDGYLPFISGNNIMSTNNNIYYLPFTLMPNQNQPCGYLNLSKMREIYLEYDSDLIETCKPVKLYIYATALNFLLLTKNSATLKYLT
jgi:hypothetical protein